MKFIKLIKAENINIEKAIEDSHYAYDLLVNKIITEDSPYFAKAIEKASKYRYSSNLIWAKIVTKDSPNFDKILEKYIKRDPLCVDRLLQHKIITEEDLQKFKDDYYL